MTLTTNKFLRLCDDTQLRLLNASYSYITNFTLPTTTFTGGWAAEHDTIHDTQRRRFRDSGSSMDGDDDDEETTKRQVGGGGLSRLSPFIWWPNFFVSRPNKGD
jgi:hypothetical protein